MIGKNAEISAKAFLQQQGLQPIAENFRCKRGEIDLIMRDKACLVFIEVRYRKNANFGGAKASIDYHKQQKIITAAQYYLQTKKLTHQCQCRFDVVCMDQQQKIDWIKNAFYAEAVW
ncbi:MAG: YraN family protein [Pseudomonadota bacterium]